jgi:hypothetical protein
MTTKPVQLPTLQPGRGDRREDCRNYVGCLTRWAKSTENTKRSYPEQPAECPPGCAHYHAVKGNVTDYARGEGPWAS